MILGIVECFSVRSIKTGAGGGYAEGLVAHLAILLDGQHVM